MSNVGKLAVCGALLAGVTAYMAYLGMSSSWQYYLTADECVAQRSSLLGARVRVAGKVARGSLTVPRDGAPPSFALEAGAAQLPVICTRSPPDNLAEQMDVIVEGRMDEAGVLRAQRVLTRCASKYKTRTAAKPMARSRSSATWGRLPTCQKPGRLAICPTSAEESP